MPADLDLALRVRADMQDALRGIRGLNRQLGDTARRGADAGAALDGAAGATQALTASLGALGRESDRTLDRARDAAESTFGAMEDAFARFATTGRLSFSSLVDSIIADLARITLRRNITEPLANALFASLPGLFAGAPVTPGATAAAAGAPAGLQPLVGHAGAIAGQLGGVRRLVPPAIFAEAQRYHGGGIAGLRPNEVPIIAERGETVLPRGAQVAMPPIEINFHNEGTPQRETRREVRLDPGRMVVAIFTDDWQKRGPIRRTIESDPPGGGTG